MPAGKNCGQRQCKTRPESLDELHHSAVDTAVNLAKQLRGDGFNDMAPEESNALIDAHAHPLTKTW